MGEKEHRHAFVAAARSLKGTPWLSKGRSTKGTDCGGFIFMSGWIVNAFDPDSDEKTYKHATKEVEGGIWGPFPGCHRVPQRSKKVGDILIMQKSLVTTGPYYCGILAKDEDGNFTLIFQRPGQRVQELPLSEIIQKRPLVGVIQRLNYPATRSRLNRRPSKEQADRDPEVITA